MKLLFRMFQFAFCCHHGHLSQEFVLPDPYRMLPPTVAGYDCAPLTRLGTLKFR